MTVGKIAYATRFSFFIFRFLEVEKTKASKVEILMIENIGLWGLVKIVRAISSITISYTMEQI